MNESFIKNLKFLEEDYRVDDLLDFSSVASDFKKTLEKITSNSIIGPVGKFGSGKSTMLFQLYKDQQDTNVDKWVVFDAWKYPERKDLWEGFILEVTKNLDKNLFEEARKKIEGVDKQGLKSLINVIFEVSNLFYPGSGIGKNFASLFKSSPARRVFEFQEIFRDVFKKTNKNLFLIVEDIDRSGDRGLFFLETLRNLIRDNTFQRRIIVIVPIGDNYFEDGKISYLKTIDYRFDFKISKIEFGKFIETIFPDEFLQKKNFKAQINYLLNLISEKKGTTIRELKHILRLADIKFRKLPAEEREKIDMRVWILFAAINYLKENVLYVIDGRQRLRDDFWGKNYLLMVANDVDEESFRRQSFRTNLPFFFEGDYYTPRSIRESEAHRANDVGHYLTGRYLEIFE